MKAELRAAWVAALRSGKYIQGEKRLRRLVDTQDRYCCLGVLCDVAQLRWVKKSPKEYCLENYTSSFPYYAILPIEFRQENNISDEVQNTLMNFNDEKKYGFNTIADWIENNVPVDADSM